MPDAPTPETLKRTRVESADGSSVDDRRNASDSDRESRKARVEDEDGDQAMEEDDDDFAPGNDADYFAEEDEEGRFFGGGLTSEQKEILNIFDNAGGEGAQIDVSVSRRCVFILIQDSFLVCGLGRGVVYHGHSQVVASV